MNNPKNPLIVLLFFVYFSAQAEWKLQNPSLTPQMLKCVFFLDSTTGWIGGSTGALFKTKDAGKTWELQKIEKNSWIYSIFFKNEKVGWAVGSFCILQTFDGGNTWLERNDIITNKVFKKIVFKNEYEGFILADSRTNNFGCTIDGGKTWQFQTFTDSKLYDLQFVDEKYAFLCGEKYIGRSIDGGISWTPSDSTIPEEMGSIIELNMIDTTYGYCICWFGICKTSNGGRTWSKCLQTPFGGKAMRTAHFEDIKNGAALFGFDSVLIFKTSDSGKTWDIFSTPIVASIEASTFPNSDFGVGVAEDGSVYSFNNLFSNIKKLTNGNAGYIQNIDFYDNLHGFCANGLYTINGGKTWTLSKLPLSSLYARILYFDSLTFLHIGHNKQKKMTSLYSSDGGASWNNSPINVQNGINDFEKIPLTKYNAFITYNNGEIIITKDAGKTAYSCTSPSSIGYTAFFLNNSDGWQVGKKVSRTYDGGLTWKVISDSLPCPFTPRDIFFCDSLKGWIGGFFIQMSDAPVYERIILVTTDGGENWKRQTNFKYSSDFSMNPAFGTPPYRIIKIRSKDGMKVWALDEFSGVFFTEDGGEHWEEQRLPCSNQRFTDMYFFNENEIWITGLNSGIWKYSNDTINIVVDKKNKICLKPKDIVYIKNSKLMFNNPILGLIQMELFDLKGSIICKYTFNKDNYSSVVDMGNINIGKGIYLIKVKSKKKYMIFRLAKITD